MAGIACDVSWWRIIKHDWSKFRPSEFIPYAEFFYGSNSIKDPTKGGPSSIQTSERIHHAFDVAWKKHQNRNDHHYEFWVAFGDNGIPEPLAMPEQAWRELCADYLGMAKTLHKNWDVMPWYSQNAGRIILHPQTRFFVESMLKRVGAELTSREDAKRG